MFMFVPSSLNQADCGVYKMTDYFVQIQSRHCCLKENKNIFNPKSSPRRKAGNVVVVGKTNYFTLVNVRLS